MRIWDGTTLDLITELPDQPGPVYAVAVTPAGDRIITAGNRDRSFAGAGMVRIWDATTLELITELPGQPGPVYAVAVTLRTETGVLCTGRAQDVP